MSDCWYFRVLITTSHSWFILKAEEAGEFGEVIATIEGSKEDLTEEDITQIDNFLWKIYCINQVYKGE